MLSRRVIRDKFVRALREVVKEELDRDRQELVDELREELLRAQRRDRRDLVAAGQREALASSARFAVEQMPTAQRFRDKYATLRHGLSLAPKDGLALEFGVYRGRTLRIIATSRREREVYGFDSFQGLPEAWRSGFPEGRFTLAGEGTANAAPQLPEVPGAVLVVGWFDETLPGFMRQHEGPVSFLHVDCDLYSSTVTVLEHVGPRLRPGSIVVFDEYFNYPGWQDGEHLAWQEYCGRHKLSYSYESYSRADEQVVVRIRD
jgi:predicted O-methyltransferase YrrM